MVNQIIQSAHPTIYLNNYNDITIYKNVVRRETKMCIPCHGLPEEGMPMKERDDGSFRRGRDVCICIFFKSAILVYRLAGLTGRMLAYTFFGPGPDSVVFLIRFLLFFPPLRSGWKGLKLRNNTAALPPDTKPYATIKIKGEKMICDSFKILADETVHI